MVFKLLTKTAPQRARPWCVLLWVCLLSLPVAAQGKLYRYVNDQGTKVIASSIPPKYVGRGYEILSPTGRVIQVIAPEPTLEDKQRVEQERALIAQYQMLARRYSSTKDIEAARDRRLASLETNIAIVRSNISTLTSQIEGEMSKAAVFERGGQKVPAHIFNNIDEMRAEVQSNEALLQLRLDEYHEIYAKFAEDAEIFVQGKALIEKHHRPAQAD